MIYAIITTRLSTRYADKNRLLLPYTLAWLGYAQYFCGEPLTIVSGGTVKPRELPQGIRHIYTPNHQTHKQCVEWVMDHLPNDPSAVYVLPQLTQPLRRATLLRDVVELARRSDRAVVTARRQPAQAWRKLTRGGWASPGADSRAEYIDGALYAWRNRLQLDDIFTPHARHAVCLSGVGSAMLDIDTEADMPAALGAMWAAELMS